MVQNTALDDTYYLEQLHFYGLGNLYARDLLSTQSADKALALTRHYLHNLGLCGYVRFLEGPHTLPARFGTKISRKLVKGVKVIKSCAACDDKICIEDDFIIVKSATTFILISRENEYSPQVDHYQDILAILIDTIDAWMENYLVRFDITHMLQDSLESLIISSRDLVNSHKASSDELFAAMVARFPTLGLQADQEDMILDIIKHTLDKHIALIEEQIRKNNLLADNLITSVDALNNSDVYKLNTEAPQSLNNIELF